jgi:hypothetical protein
MWDRRLTTTSSRDEFAASLDYSEKPSLLGMTIAMPIIGRTARRHKW